MSKAGTFADSLQQFQYELCAKWRDKYKKDQNIAVSIQLSDAIQDRTRACTSPKASLTGAPTAINSFCQRILDEQWIKNNNSAPDCDQLDSCLKLRFEAVRPKAKSKSVLAGYSCRCHAGISNILIPIVHNEGDVWHVFFGQFLLKAGDSEIQRTIMANLCIEPIISISDIEKGFLQENVFVDEALYQGRYRSNISLIELSDFVAFRSYALNEIADFLNDVYSTPEKRKILDHYKKVINEKTLTKLCSALILDINCDPELKAPDKQKWRQKIASVMRAAPSLSDERMHQCILWAQAGLNGIIDEMSEPL